MKTFVCIVLMLAVVLLFFSTKTAIPNQDFILGIVLVWGALYMIRIPPRKTA